MFYWSMRVFLLNIVLFFAGFQICNSQINPIPTGSRWITASPYEFGDDRICTNLHHTIFHFFHKDSIQSEIGGVSIKSPPVSYLFENDRFTFYSPDSTLLNFEVKKRTSGKIKITMDSLITSTLWKLPEYDLDFSAEDIKGLLKDTVWEFEWKHRRQRKSIINFKSSLLDFNIVKSEFQSEVMSFHMQTLGSIEDYGASWGVYKHGKDLVLRLEDVMGSMLDIAFVIKRVEKEKIQLVYWTCQGKKTTWANKIDLSDSVQITDLLVNRYWRYSRTLPEREKKKWQNTGMSSKWLKSDDQYHRDSTLLIQESDLENQWLRFKFNRDKSYQIFRDQRVIDEGIWQPLFDHRTIELKSGRTNSEGIIGGFLFINEISENSLTLRRQLKMERDMSYSYETTSPESYIGEQKK